MPYSNKKKQIIFLREWRKKNPGYMNDWRKSNPEKDKSYSKNNPEKVSARYVLGYAVRSGKVKKMPCEVCGSETSEAHHEDYSKPLEVRWFCRKHHDECHHGKIV